MRGKSTKMKLFLISIFCFCIWPTISQATPILYDVGGSVWLSGSDQYFVTGSIVIDDEWSGGYTVNTSSTSADSLYSWDYTFDIVSFDLSGESDMGQVFSSVGSSGYITFHRGPMGSDGGDGRWLLEDAGFAEPWGGRSNFRSAIPGDFGLDDFDPNDFHLADTFGLNGSWNGFPPPMSNLTLNRACVPIPEPNTIFLLGSGMFISSLWGMCMRRRDSKLHK